jgi:hypothetical protein
VTGANVEVLLARLDQVRKYGEGWRAKCPACGGRSRDKVSVCIGNTGAILIKCFAGCEPQEVVEAAGLQMGDLFPERLRPETPEERRRMRMLARQVGWGAALEVLEFEARIVLIAAAEIAAGTPLCDEDRARLALAQERIEGARAALTEVPRYKPAREGVAG